MAHTKFGSTFLLGSATFLAALHAIAHPRDSLTAQAGDPTAPLLQAQVTYLYSDTLRDSSNDAQQLLLEPVIPIPPSRVVPVTQIVRPSVPFLDAPDGKSGLGDISLEHVFLPANHSWGAFGVGYTATVPTADHRDLGAGKYQLGPAAMIIYYGIENWQIGATITQSWSIDGVGNAAREDVSDATVQPIVNYLWGDWYIGIGDFTWSYDWKDNQGWTIPLGFQVGRITQVGHQKFNLSAELMWVPIHNGPGSTPKSGIKVGMVWLLPE